jgi:molybdate transport system regulatory protein
MTEAANAARDVSVTPTVRLRLEHDGVPAFGPGPYELLCRVKDEGSLHRAAQSMHMAYSKAWRIVRDAEQHLGLEILDRKAGGVAGGGSVLTVDGEELVRRFGALQDDLRNELERLYDAHFGDRWPSRATPADGSATSERRVPARPPDGLPTRGART